MKRLRRTPLAFVRRAVKLAKRHGVVSSGQVAYDICKSPEAAALDFEVWLALSRSQRFRRVSGLFKNVKLFELRESAR